MQQGPELRGGEKGQRKAGREEEEREGGREEVRPGDWGWGSDQKGKQARKP